MEIDRRSTTEMKMRRVNPLLQRHGRSNRHALAMRPSPVQISNSVDDDLSIMSSLPLIQAPVMGIMWLLGGQHAKKDDEPTSTQEISADSDCISVNAKAAYSDSTTKISPEMGVDEGDAAERPITASPSAARSPTNSLRASAESFVQENRQIQGLNRLRLFCAAIVNHTWVQHFIIFLTVVNAVMLGVATYDFVKENSTLNSAFATTDMIILIIFTIELGMQLLYHGYNFIKSGWLVFDFVIVIVSWSAASLQAFRILRVLKLVSRIKSLRDVVAALAKVLPRLGAIAALLGLISYIFAVMFTEMFGDLILSEDYFSTLDRSLLTCFQMVTLEWGDIMRECMTQVWWAWIPFVSFIVITGFIVFNLIVAVVCEAVSEISKASDKERRKSRRMTNETMLE